MYENNKDRANSGLKDLESFLQLIADLDKEIELFAMGGTAMVLKNIKEATKDIDFLAASDYQTINGLFKLAGLREKDSSKLCNIWHLGDKRIDIFYDAFVMGITLPDDWKELSEHIRDLGKLRLYILNWYDIIITKTARSEPRDIDDILAILKTQKIDFKALKNRYYKLAPVSLIADYDTKFRHLNSKLKNDFRKTD